MCGSESDRPPGKGDRGHPHMRCAFPVAERERERGREREREGEVELELEYS